MDEPSRWTEADLAYFAGIIDGEGSICLHNFGTHRFGCGLHVGNTNPRLLEWIASRFGGVIRAEKRSSARWKPVGRWTASADDIDAILQAVKPFLIIKREQAELMLSYRRTLGRKVRTKRSTDDVSESVKHERFAIHQRLSLLNRRGA